MFKFFKNFKVTSKIVSLCAVSAVILIITIISGGFQLYSQAMDERRDKVKSLVQLTISVLKDAHEQEKAGTLTKEQAQKQAANSIDKMIYNKDDYFFIVDTHGLLIAHPHRRDKIGQNVYKDTDNQGTQRYKLMIEAARDKPEFPYIEYYHTRPGAKPGEVFKKITCSQLFEPWGWVVNTGIYVDDVLDSVIKNIAVQSAIAFLCLGILFFVTLMVSSADLNAFLALAQRSLTHVEEVLEKLSQGDLKARMLGQHTGVFENLQKSTNSMATRLQDVISQMVRASGSIYDIVENVAKQNEKLSIRTENQACNLQETASSMEEISATIRLTSHNAKQASEHAITSEKLAIDGESRAFESVSAINAIQESFSKVFGVIEMINDISFQTNLLALNASVEAARAGEHGKGFAVVAEEVRSLAQRCAGAAKEIQELIKESNKHVLEGVKLTQETGDSFKEIVVSTKNLSRLVSEIALASVEQATGVQQINMAISKMDEVTQQNAGLVQEELRVVEQLRDEAQKMSEMVKMFH